MPSRRIAAYHGLFTLLALVICLRPAPAQDFLPRCQTLGLPPPTLSPPNSPVDIIQIEVPNTFPFTIPGPYVGRLTASISRNLLLRLPESVANGEEGMVVIRVQLRKDGSLSKDGVSVACTSGKKDMDAAAQSAIQSGAPFEPLPQTYGGSDLVLLFRISYRYVPRNPSRTRRT